MTNGNSPAGWYQDPTGQGDARYWNGTSWTESVDRGGVTVNVAIDPSQAQVPPVPGTRISIPAPPTGSQNVTVSSPRRSPIAAIVGVFVVLMVVIVILFLAINNDSSDDTPTPGTDAPPATEAPSAPPTTEAPSAPPTTDPPGDGN